MSQRKPEDMTDDELVSALKALCDALGDEDEDDDDDIDPEALEEMKREGWPGPPRNWPGPYGHRGQTCEIARSRSGHASCSGTRMVIEEEAPVDPGIVSAKFDGDRLDVVFTRSGYEMLCDLHEMMKEDDPDITLEEAFHAAIAFGVEEVKKMN